ncbi:MAG: NYN domain-containing protein [Planctomycetota bacterium]
MSADAAPTLPEPNVKRARVFVDGQNLFHHARELFGYTHPNYDVLKLAGQVTQKHGWRLDGVHFYTGVPEKADNAFWHVFWAKKLAAMGTQGIKIFARPLRYRMETVRLKNGGSVTAEVGREKGVDVRIAIDILRHVIEDTCDVVVVFSQDQDLSEVAKEIRVLSRLLGRWVKIASAFPFDKRALSLRGINDTDWIKITRAEYDQCLDPRDYRP